MKLNIKVPSAFTILLGLTVLVAVLSWFIPVGQFERRTDEALGREVPVAGSFRPTESTPQGPGDVALAPISGFYDADSNQANAIDIVLFVLVLGGFMNLVNKTGLFQALVTGMTKRLKGRELFLIPAMMLAFAVAGSTGAMYEESLTLYILVIPAFLAAGFDRLTVVAVIFLGINIGVVASTINPYSTIIASTAAQTAFTDGIGPRLAVWAIGTAFAIAWTMRYAKRVLADPARSLVSAADNQHYRIDASPNGASRITTMQWLVLAVFIAAYTVMFTGVLAFDWWMAQMSAVFLVASIVVGLLARFSEEDIVEHFLEGARQLLGVALIIGVARGVVVIMDNSQMTDTLLHSASMLLDGMPKVAFINLMYWVQFLIGFLVPSSSGAAVLTMPIMAPLGDLAGIERSLVVSAYQYGNGMMNIVTPTNATLIGSLMLARVGLDAWYRFVWPILLFMTALIMLTLSLGVL